MRIIDEKSALDAIPAIFAQNANVLIGPGDDCAVLDFGGSGNLRLLAVDQLVSDVHYIKNSTSPAEIAAKLIRRNISDMAAMGGLPAEVLLTMALSEETWRTEKWPENFLAAIADEAERWNVSVCGGDISSSGSTSDLFSLTITGWVEKERLTPRSAASPGDLLYATGKFGNSFDSGRHLTFQPRLDEARFLAGAFAKAMIDVSDGLVLDAARIAEMSKTGLLIDKSRIPLAEGASIEKALTEGEDYELLFSVPPAKSVELEKIWPFHSVDLSRIGIFTAADAKTTQKQNELDVLTAAKKGFTHFSE